MMRFLWFMRVWVLAAAMLLPGVFVQSAAALTAEEQLRFADGIYLRGLYDAAAGEYLAFVKAHPAAAEIPAALYRVAECYRHSGNKTGAELFYRRVMTDHATSPFAARAGIRQAEGFLAAGDAKAAAERFEGLLAAGNVPADMLAAAWYYLGNSRMKARDRKGAEAAYAHLLAAWPQSPYAAYASLDLAALQGAKGGVEEMTRLFQQAEKAAATPGARAEALFRWGDWAYRRGDYQTAADTFQVLAAELPGEKRAADARLAAAWSLFYLEQSAAALEFAEAAYEAAADAETAAAALYLQANCLRAMNRDGEALALYQDVVRQYPGSAMAARAGYERMLTEFRRGAWAAALDAAPAAPAAENEADVLWMRAESHRALGQTLAAQQDYVELGGKFPENVQQPLALVRLAEMARGEGRLADAAALFEQAAAHEAATPETAAAAWEAAARAQMALDAPEKALADWAKRLALAPQGNELADVLLEKGMAEIALGQADAALKTLDGVSAAKPAPDRLARAAYWRGVLLAEQEDFAGAERAFRQCLGADVEPQVASLARLRLTLALQRLERMDEAADQLQPLIGDAALVAENPALTEWFITQRFEQGDYPQAAKAARTLAQSGAADAWRQLGWYWAGAAARASGRVDEAAEAFRAAVALPVKTREGVEARLLLADMELAAKQFAAAAEQYRAAADEAAEDALDVRARAYFGLAEAAAAAGQDEDAARHYLSVAILFDDPELSPQALFAAAEAYDRLGKTALRDSTQADLRERYPESSYARQLGGSHP